jgi:hypothetical protein
MPNQSGSVYGLTILSPIVQDERTQVSADLAIRLYLAGLDRNQQSPFAKVSSTHLARLVVMDDVVYVGRPACEEHLTAQYLVFESNFDGDLDTYLGRLAREAGVEVDSVWKHCVGYPGVQNVAAFKAYMRACQVTTTFFFADVNDKTVQQTLLALRTQKAVADFIEKHQGLTAEQIQRAFGDLVRRLRALPAPLPGTAWEQRHLSRQAAQSYE